MHLASRRGAPFHNEAVNYTFPLGNAVLAEHINGEERNSPNVVDYSDVFALSGLFQDDGKYGSVTEEFKLLHAQRMQVLDYLSALATSSPGPCSGPQMYLQASGIAPLNQYTKQETGQSIMKSTSQDVIDLDEANNVQHRTGFDITSMIAVDLDGENDPYPFQGIQGNAIAAIGGKRLPSIQYEKVILKKTTEKQTLSSVEFERHEVVRAANQGEAVAVELNLQNKRPEVVKRGRKRKFLAIEVNVERETRVNSSLNSSDNVCDYLPSMGTHTQVDTETSDSDGLEDLWKDMFVAMECSKGVAPSEKSSLVQEEDCCHSFMLEDDLGLVCRVCGVIQRRIETLIDYQWTKAPRTTRTYIPGSRNSNLADVAECSGTTNISEHLLIAADISIHPRHMKQMKPHQIEGFNFLVKNLLADPPGGCILAHAPGSGKTFMLISFIQSFMAKDPCARPLVVLPKGILSTWRKEFDRWKIEDIPLYDFYSSKADNRAQQLEVLNRWQENRSILLLGYKQFANIICESGDSRGTVLCQEKLLKVPTLLILDEGHTPRNDKTDMVGSLAKVRTPCKVVLSGTLFQNHVGEVFNILKLVRPNFMKCESSRTKIKRILSRVNILGRRPTKGNLESYFCDLVEETLRNDGNYKRKISVIKELRDMTCDVLHYYKGDFLDELPGLVDFTVLLKLGDKQKNVIRSLGKLDKFKKSSVEKAIYMHPQLMELRENASGDKDNSINVDKLDSIIDSINIADGVKTNFFLNLLSMAESSREKLLVFSQYLLPLKFLERFVVRVKGWHSGKEIFVISGDSSPEHREWSMDQFNNSPDAKVFFGSIKACGEGISLVGASRIVILDVHLNPSVTRQAIGRAFRPGQEKTVYTYRLVAADSQEEEDHNTSFRKELISKMWFEWNGNFRHGDFELDAVDIAESQDMFFENPALGEDIKALYRR